MRSVIEVERQRAGGSRGLPPADQPAGSGRVSLLTRTRQFVADPRRRRGRHSAARQFLTEGDGPAAVAPGVWDGLLTALRRHTVQASLTALGEKERQVLHMAYLDGQTNAEIAATLSVSESTVRRRISAALAALDSQIERAGTWASAILLVLVAFAVGRARTVGHAVSTLRATPAGNLVLMTTAGVAASAVVVGAVVINQGGAAGSGGSTHSVPRVTAGAPFLDLTPPGGGSAIAGATSNDLQGNSAGAGAGASAGTGGNTSGAQDPGCDGNPTSAPATTPVGPRGAHLPGQSPVTHPVKGGCGPHGVEAA